MTDHAASLPPADILLPPPDRSGGRPLMEALARRASGRRFSPRPLPDALLGSLLWAAVGINRPDSGKRTAPTACNWREIGVIVLRADGAYRYDPEAHALRGLAAGDLRPLGGVQPFVATAPAVLVFTADLEKMKGADEDGRRFYPACDTGYASANVGLVCASEGLQTVPLISVDKPALHRRLGLPPDELVTLTQPVGWA